MKSLVLALLLAVCHGVAAQDLPFPQRQPIEITVLFPAGTSADVTARLLADGMAKQLGQRVMVVNRPGAGGAIGYKHVAAQKPDGYALVWNSNSISTTYHSGQLELDYRAFDAVARVLAESPVVAVRSDARWKNLDELVRDARENPKRISVGNSGVGSHTHICSVALFGRADVEVTDVPFAAAQVVPNLMGRHVDAVIQLPPALAAPLKQGTVRLLATLTAARDPAFPDVPTAREQGYDVALDAWRGIAVPKGTPRPVVAALEGAIRNTAAAPDFQRGSENLGIRPAFLSSSKFNELIAREDAMLSQLMQRIGIKR